MADNFDLVSEDKFIKAAKLNFSEMLERPYVVTAKITVNKTTNVAIYKAVFDDDTVFRFILVGMDLSKLKGYKSDRAKRDNLIHYFHQKNIVQTDIAEILSVSQALVSTVLSQSPATARK